MSDETIRKLKKALVLMGRPVNRAALLRQRVAASIEHDAALKALPYDLIVDVGANRGQFSLASRHFRPNAKIIAFEPLASAAEVYRSVFTHDPKTTLHQTALGPVAGRATMQRSGSEDSSSLLPIGEMMSELYPGTEAVGTEEVAVAPLTDFVTDADLSGCSMLKIDVQGFEIEVLKSAEPLLAKFDRLYVEASFVPFYDSQPLAHEVIAYLQTQGFRLAGFMNPSFHPKTGLAVQADLLFISPKG